MSEFSRNVLIIDDSKPMRAILRQICSTLGFVHIVEAGDGKEALRALRANDISLVISDWHMPNMDGMQFIQEVKSLPEYEDLPIIVVTTEAEKSKILVALMNGVADYIVKPFIEATVKQKITAVMRRPRKS